MFIKKAIVTEADLESMADPNGGQTLIIVDDNSISAASSKEVAQVFTIARHKNCSIVLLLHFIFGPWPSSRIISANTAYFFLLKSPRMAQQIATLGSQLGKQKELVSVYTQESQKPYGYVLVDLCTNTPDHMRIRSDIVDEKKSEQGGSLLKIRSLSPVTQGQQEDKDCSEEPRIILHQPKTKWIKCFEPLQNDMRKKINHKKLTNRHRKKATVASNKISTVHFVNFSRPYI